MWTIEICTAGLAKDPHTGNLDWIRNLELNLNSGSVWETASKFYENSQPNLNLLILMNFKRKIKLGIWNELETRILKVQTCNFQ